MKKYPLALVLLLICSPMALADEPDWINDKIQEVGEGVYNTKRFPDPGQAQLMAQKAAILDGKPNLPERVLSLSLDSETLVRDVVTVTDWLDAANSGLVEKAYVIDSQLEGDISIYTINMGLNLRDVYMYLKEAELLK